MDFVSTEKAIKNDCTWIGLNRILSVIEKMDEYVYICNSVKNSLNTKKFPQ